MFTTKSLLAGAASLALATAANAAITLTINPVYVTSYVYNTADEVWEDVGQQDLDPMTSTRGLDPIWNGMAHSFFFTMQLDGLTAGQDWANMGLSVKLNGNATDPSLNKTPWTSVGSFFDLNGSSATTGTGTAHWGNNADAGTDTTDLQGILVSTNGAVAKSRQYGESGRYSTVPQTLAQATVNGGLGVNNSPDDYNYTGPATTNPGRTTRWLSGAQNAFNDFGGAAHLGMDLGFPTIFGYVTFIDNVTNAVTVSVAPGEGTYLQIFESNANGDDGTPTNAEVFGVSFVSEGITLPLVPEPASLGLLGLAGLAIARRRRS